MNNQGKLVRNKIPAIIRKDGGNPKFKILTPEEYRKELVRKINEESSELTAALKSGDKTRIIEESADLFQALFDMFSAYGIPASEVGVKQIEKREERGGFDGGVFLESC